MNTESAGTFSDNEERKRFELQVGEITAFVDYIINKKGEIYLTHTEVPEDDEGRGLAKEMLEMFLRRLRRES